MNYAKIVPCDIANGPGVRATIFCTGCLHHCHGCHNPQTWDPNAGQPFTDETLDKIVDLLRPDYIQGLTLTGGDPLYPENRKEIGNIIHRICHEFGTTKDIWLWTGYKWEEIWNQNDLEMSILAGIDVLVDGPFIEAEKDISLPYMGSKNQRVIDIRQSLRNEEPTLWWAPGKKGK